MDDRLNLQCEQLINGFAAPEIVVRPLPKKTILEQTNQIKISYRPVSMRIQKQVGSKPSQRDSQIKMLVGNLFRSQINSRDESSMEQWKSQIKPKPCTQPKIDVTKRMFNSPDDNSYVLFRNKGLKNPESSQNKPPLPSFNSFKSHNEKQSKNQGIIIDDEKAMEHENKWSKEELICQQLRISDNRGNGCFLINKK